MSSSGSSSTHAVNLLSAVDRDSLSDKAYDVIVRYIIQTDLQQGERLPSERKFSKLLEVSREVIRGALERLENEGVIERRIGSGVYLRQLPTMQLLSLDLPTGTSRVTLDALYQARIALEVGAMEWIVEEITEPELVQLEHTIDRMAARLSAGHPIVGEDRAFHIQIMQASRNPILVEFTAIVQRYFDEVREFAPKLVIDNLPDQMELRHRRIIEAVRNRDIAGAQRAMRMHFAPFPTQRSWSTDQRSGSTGSDRRPSEDTCKPESKTDE